MSATLDVISVSDFQARLQHAIGDDFLLERELDGAGMSRVFVALERALQRRVVIKVLPPELAAGVNVERFRREIQLAAQLQHPHIVPLLAAGEDDHLLWFSMPYIEGESLRQALARSGRLSARDVVRILHDVVDALAYAHTRGIVHRDIKPGNILTQGMHALVTDFGVAKALSEAIPLHGGTTTGMAIGTPAYMAPEQLAADPAADHRVDLYAVGLLAYELLTGKSPFSGNSPQATLAAQLTHMPPSPHDVVADVPAPLSAIIMQCLEKQASKRPQTAQALLAELEALPPMTGGTIARSMPLARRSRVRAALAGALVVGVAAWALTSRPTLGTRASGGADSLDTRPSPRARGRIANAPTARDADAAPRAASETIPVFREVGDGTPSTTVPIVLTRAESLAIAEAVGKRQAQQKTAQKSASPEATDAAAPAPASASAIGANRVFVHTTDGALTEVDRQLIMAEVGRVFADSMARALKEINSAFAAVRSAPRTLQFDVATGGPPAPGAPGGRGTITTITPLLAPPTDNRVRVMVMPFTNATSRRELGGLTREMTQALRSAIPADRFDVISEEVLDRAARAMPDRLAMGWGLRADYMLSGMISARGDSLVYLTQIIDVRSGRFSRYAEVTVPQQEARRGFEPSKAQVTAWLDTAATIATRRPPGFDGRNGPDPRGTSRGGRGGS
ncbi:MAG: serine/threonine protein kinase [Gemmatimonadetes bacterium]|nr:serine/threonine protein kinase [Gemmatimonadota bacterium]